MRRAIKIGTVSWISRDPNPMSLALEALLYTPDWVPKTYLGLAATSNPDPGDTIDSFSDFRGSRAFRALTYCNVDIETNDTTGAVTRFQVIQSFYDPGFTPPFSQLHWPSTFLKPDPAIWSFTWYPGEASPLSQVCTQQRHPNTTITGVPASETVIMNAVIKFRAGKHTDDVGINSVKAPFHVPWVWCEVLVTLAANKLRLYGCGSTFPSHAWYIDGNRVAKVTQTADTAFPKRPLVPTSVPRPPNAGPLATMPNPFAIAVEQMLIYPVLSAGASASGPQIPLDADAGLTTPVDKHPNTAPAIDVITA